MMWRQLEKTGLVLLVALVGTVGFQADGARAQPEEDPVDTWRQNRAPLIVVVACFPGRHNARSPGRHTLFLHVDGEVEFFTPREFGKACYVHCQNFIDCSPMISADNKYTGTQMMCCRCGNMASGLCIQCRSIRYLWRRLDTG